MFSIRSGTCDDISWFATLERQPNTARWLGRTGEAWHERALTDPAQEHLIAEDDGIPMGFAVLAGLQSAEGIAELRRIIISAPCRGLGLGRALLRSAIARAYGHHNAHRIWLDVKAQNLNARRLYYSEGFRDVSPEFVAEKAFPITTTETGEPDPELIVMMHTSDRMGIPSKY